MVGWSNISYRPITNRGNDLVAVSSNLAFGGALTAIPASEFTTDVWGRPQLMTSTQKTVIDGQQNAYLNSVTFCKYLSSNGGLAFNNYNAALQYVSKPVGSTSNQWTSGHLTLTDTQMNYLTESNGIQVSQVQLDKRRKNDGGRQRRAPLWPRIPLFPSPSAVTSRWGATSWTSSS